MLLTKQKEKIVTAILPLLSPYNFQIIYVIIII